MLAGMTVTDILTMIFSKPIKIVQILHTHSYYSRGISIRGIISNIHKYSDMEITEVFYMQQARDTSLIHLNSEVFYT
jgi:hypothetical protein